MSKRSIAIVIAAVAGLAVLFTLALAGAILTFNVLRDRPLQVRAAVQPQVDPNTGVLVSSVAEAGPAAEAGIVRGDILLEYEGAPLETFQDLQEKLSASNPGDSVAITVLHGDEERVINVTLGDRAGSAYLGLTPCGPNGGTTVRRMELTPGAFIIEVVPDGPADEAGIQVGDVITSVNGEALTQESDLADIISGYAPGDSLTLEVSRLSEDQPLTLEATLGEHPDDPEHAYLGVRYSSRSSQFSPDGEMPFVHPFEGGPDLPNMPFRFRDDEGLPALPEDIDTGAIISQVAEGSPAEEAGLQPNWIIVGIDGEALTSPKGFAEKIASMSPGDEVTLSVYDPETEETKEIPVVLGEHPDDAEKAYLGVEIRGFFLRQERITPPNSEAPDASGFFDRLPLEDLPFWERGFEFETPRLEDLITPGQAL